MSGLQGLQWEVRSTTSLTDAAYGIITMTKQKKSRTIFVWLSVIVVIAGVVALAIGRSLFAESDVFRWIWRLVWFVGVPLVLVASFRLAVRGRNKSSETSANTVDPKDRA